MRLRSLLLCLIPLVVLLCCATPALAQEPFKGDIAVSYSALWDDSVNSGSGGWMPTGVLFAFAGRLNPLFSVVGEVGVNYKTLDVEGVSFKTNVIGYLGGIRFSRQVEKVMPFAQVLIGGARANFSALGTTASDNAFVIQPGAGVDVFVRPNIAIRAQGDYRLIRNQGENGKEFRLAFGAVYAF